MKKKINKKILTLGSCISIIAPITGVISCSTSWAKWHKNENQIITKYKFQHKTVDPIKFSIRAKAQIMQAYDVATSTIDLNKLNNFFELIQLIGYSSKIKTSQNIDEWYDKANWNHLKDYINNIQKQISYHFKYTNSKGVETISNTSIVDLTQEITNIIQGFNSYTPNIAPATNLDGTANPLSGKDLSKAYDVEWHGVSGGQPRDLGQVAIIGAPLLSIPSVSAIKDMDSSYALKLSKLVNIPKYSFDQFILFLTKLDTLFASIYSSNSIREWEQDKAISPAINENGVLSNSSFLKRTLDNQLKLTNKFKGQAIKFMLKNT